MVAPKERLNWFLTAGFGAQHFMVMFGATMIVPLLTGFPATTTLFFTGVGTLVFLLVTRNRVPSYLGASFAFVAPLQAALGQSMPLSVRVGAVLAVGLLMVVIGIAVKALGARLLESLMPPVVTGTVVILIGITLAPKAVQNALSQSGLAAVTLLVTLFCAVVLRGMLARTAVLIGLVVGWVVAGFNGDINPVQMTFVDSQPWIGLPVFNAPEFRPSLVLAALPALVVLVAENIGHLKVIAAGTNRDLDGSAGDTLIGNGLATTLAGLGGGNGTTTYAENIGVMTATKVYSTAAYVVAAGLAIALSFSPKLGALLNTAPPGVIAGASLVLYGLIAMVGFRIWLDARIDLANPVTFMVAGTALIVGIANVSLKIGGLDLGPVATGTLLVLVLHPLLNWLRGLTHGYGRRPAHTRPRPRSTDAAPGTTPAPGGLGTASREPGSGPGRPDGVADSTGSHGPV
ncbi:uracil-xanthine permease [Crossiella equi]|uniref:Uracil-xanthine permease n=1 Tax=Crossiella equi TaxID=130796 RepID=A0ABS5AKW5_9PSEU|nr:solute carrier family 23 protein [Crossiella equi]MBP2477209.1 uracil-xanthine permease [Crossiella equi]